MPTNIETVFLCSGSKRILRVLVVTRLKSPSGEKVLGQALWEHSLWLMAVETTNFSAELSLRVELLYCTVSHVELWEDAD
jgi:hypothetical protein